MTDGILNVPTSEPVASPSAAAAAPAADTAKTPATDATPSFADQLPEDLRGTVGAKMKDAAELARAYANLEKYMGADKNDILKLPKERTPEAMKELYKVMGVPDSADSYEISLPENSAFTAEDIGTLKEIAHRNGVTPQAIQEMVKWYEETSGKLVEGYQQDSALQVQQAKQNLQKDWGLAYDTNIRLINAFINKNAATPEEAAQVRNTIGSNEVLLRLFQRQAEQTIPAKDLDVLLHGRPTSPEQARARMAEIARDPLWMDAKQLNNPIRQALVAEHASLAKVVNS